MVEHDLAKVGVAGSTPVSRSIFLISKICNRFKKQPNKFTARMAESVDARDLKSLEHLFVPVQVRLRAPYLRYGDIAKW